jgi:ribonuclease R
MTLVCCKIVRKGKFVAAEPWFEHGHPLSLGNGKTHGDAVGKLAIVDASLVKNTGRIVEVLGSVDSVHAAMRGLLAEAGRLGRPGGGRGAHATGSERLGAPSRAVREQLEELPGEIPFLAEREDHRGDLVVTIDPPTAKDHDDAIGLEAAPAGSVHAWTLAVHIADVSAYVPAGSPIDVEAMERAMSTYVPGTVAPMLPFELSSDLCSLRPGVDRGCVSAFLDLADDGEVVRTRFARTVIRSARRLSYDQVDRVLLGREAIDPVIDTLLANFAEVTAKLRARRMARGALDMALPEVELTLGEMHVEEARLSSESRSHQLVEECMLLANDAVGLALANADAPGIWRIHEHPDPEAIAALVESFDKLGIPTPPIPEHLSGRGAAAVIADIVRSAVRYSETSRRGRLSFAPRVLRAVQRAMYRATPGPHSGLATENYAHFTSPIRRYPDLVVHRSLLALIGAGDDEPAVWSLGQVAEHVTTVEGELQKLERTADKIAAAYLLHRRMHAGEALGDEGDGIWTGEIVGMVGGGMFVRFGDIFDGFVPARSLSPEERYDLDEDGLAMVGGRSGHRFRIGDAIKVYVDKVERSSGRIDLRREGSIEPERRGGNPYHGGGSKSRGRAKPGAAGGAAGAAGGSGRRKVRGKGKSGGAKRPPKRR